MNLEVILKIIARINGCTFATIDSTSDPQNGIIKVTTGERVLLFNNEKSSGYENMVKRRLLEAGKDASDFSVGDLPWGERVEVDGKPTPLIAHKGNHYLQTIRLAKGKEQYFLNSLLGRKEIKTPAVYGFKERRTNQGLPRADEVLVSTYRLDHIDRIALMGEEVFGDDTAVGTKDTVTPLDGAE